MNIIFDLDGTLMDTLKDLAISTNFALRTCGMPERTIDEVRRFVGNGVKRLIEQAVPQGTDQETFDRVFAQFKSHYVEHCQDNSDLYPGIRSMLTRLKSEGHKMAVVSNKLQSGVDELQKQYFRQWIDVAIGERPDIPRKPCPDMVNLAMKELGATTADSIYVGDSDVDLATARNSGLPCISVLWGFRDEAFLLSHGATTFANSPEDIVNKVSSLEQGLGVL